MLVTLQFAHPTALNMAVATHTPTSANAIKDTWVSIVRCDLVDHPSNQKDSAMPTVIAWTMANVNARKDGRGPDAI